MTSNGVHRISHETIFESNTKSSRNNNGISHVRLARIDTRITDARKFKSHPKICHAKSYSLLRTFIEHFGIPSTRSCYKLQPHRHAIDVKLMNWLLLYAIDNKTNASECWILLERKLHWLLPLLRRCNGDVNFIDNHGQTILHIFMEKYVAATSDRSMPREFLLKILKLTKNLLEQGASVNIADENGNTPMHFAAKRKIKPLIVLLTSNFTNINARDIDERNTVLHILADSHGSTEKFKFIINALLIKGANANSTNKHGNTPVHLSAKHSQLETLDIFKRNGADFSKLGEKGKNMLHFVVSSCLRNTNDESKKIKTIDFLINEGCQINDSDDNGFSALHYAASCYGNSKVVQKLIKLGADAKMISKNSNETPLHMAVKCDFKSIEILLKVGADIDAMTFMGITPLHYTIIHGNSKSMDCLIRNGADINRRCKIVDLTPLHMTALACKKKLELLISKGVDVNVTNARGITALHLAAITGNVEMMDILIKHGADVNCRDEILTSTPLHWSAKKVNGKIDTSVFVNLKDEQSEIIEYWTSLLKRKISTNDCSEVMKTLLKNGALTELKDKTGHSPLYYVVKNDNLIDLKYLLKHGVNINDDDVSESVASNSDDSEMKHHLLWHAMKLKQIGMSINSKYKFNTYDTEYWRDYRNCLDEVLALKSHAIDDNDKVSIYDFLRMNPTSRYAYVERVLLSDPGVNYPWYYDIIMASCREALDRKLLLKNAMLSIRRLSGLPQICCQRILLYLSNEMLKTVVYATSKSEADK